MHYIVVNSLKNTICSSMKKVVKIINLNNKHVKNYKFVLIFNILVFSLILFAGYISSRNVERVDIYNKNLDRFAVKNDSYKERQTFKFNKKVKEIKNIPIEERKSYFVSKMLPIIEDVNNEILNKRKQVFAIDRKLKTNSLTVLDADTLKRLFREYKIKNNDIDELKKRIDIIPVSLVLAQAAIESGWGTSRFALEGNAYFGQKIIGSNSNGIIPNENTNPLIKVRKFKNLKDSVEAYVKNLNTHFAYKNFRNFRKQQRSMNTTLIGNYLANTLDNYSELGTEYTQKLILIIKENNLEKYDYLEYKSVSNYVH